MHPKPTGLPFQLQSSAGCRGRSGLFIRLRLEGSKELGLLSSEADRSDRSAFVLVWAWAHGEKRYFTAIIWRAVSIPSGFEVDIAI